MKFLLFFLFPALYGLNICQAQQPIPYREASSYKFILNYNLKEKLPPLKNYALKNASATKSLLPYVKIKLQMLKVLENDFRVKVVCNQGYAVYNKKVREPLEIDLELGFTADLVNRLVPHVYYVNFMDRQKNILSQIVIEVTESGSLMVNEQVYEEL